MGEPVGAVYGFAKDIFTLIERHQPDCLFCAFDLPEQTFRSAIYAEYKANRSEMPDDLRPQIGFVHEILDAMNIPGLAQPGFEADDVMATAARMIVEQNGNCVVVTSDKDCRQLINDHVSIFNLRKGIFYTAENLLADWGIRPDQVIDFQSLVGDSTDNIPGVAKVGPKTATELLQQFGTLEGIYENIEKITGKKKEYLLVGKESAFLSRRLVALKNDVPIQVDWTPYSGFNAEKLRALFQRFGFKSLMGKLGTTQERQDNQSPLSFWERAGGRGDTTSERIHSPHPNPLPEGEGTFIKNPTYHLVDTQELFSEFYAQLQQQTLFSFDTETAPMAHRFDATSPRYTVIVGMSFAWNDNEAWYLPFRGPLGAVVLPLQQTLDTLRPILEDPKIKKNGQNLKYDIIVLKNAGVHLQGIAFDTMLADYILRN